MARPFAQPAPPRGLATDRRRLRNLAACAMRGVFALLIGSFTCAALAPRSARMRSREKHRCGRERRADVVVGVAGTSRGESGNADISRLAEQISLAMGVWFREVDLAGSCRSGQVRGFPRWEENVKIIQIVR